MYAGSNGVTGPFSMNPGTLLNTSLSGGMLPTGNGQKRLGSRSENKFKLLTERSPVGIYIMNLTGEHLLTYVNPRFAEIFGYTVDELTRKKNFPELVSAADIEQFRNVFKESISSGADSIQHEFQGTRKNGETITVEIYGSLTNVQGEPGVIGTLVDITDRKKMEISLKEKVNYVQALMDTIPAPVFYRDIHGSYHDCNRGV